MNQTYFYHRSHGTQERTASESRREGRNSSAQAAGIQQPCHCPHHPLQPFYQIYCTENNLPALKPRSFSEALIACQSRYNLEYCNNVTNAAGRRVRGFLGIEVLVRNHISVFSGDSMRTYVPEDVPEEWRR